MASQKRKADTLVSSGEANKRHKSLIAGLKQLYCSGALTDLTIACQDKSWKVHKAIVCSQSEYFQKQCTGEFKEAKENRIQLNDDDPEVVGAVVHYLYNFDYGNPSDHGHEEDSEITPPILYDVRIFATADRLLMASLKELSAEKFAQHAESEWDTLAFAAAIMEVYNTIPEHEDCLKQVVLGVVMDHAKELLDGSEAHDYFRTIFNEVPEFGADIAIALAKTPGNAALTTYRCPASFCGRTFKVSVPAGARFSCPNRHFVDDHIWWSTFVVQD